MIRSAWSANRCFQAATLRSVAAQFSQLTQVQLAASMPPRRIAANPSGVSAEVFRPSITTAFSDIAIGSFHPHTLIDAQTVLSQDAANLLLGKSALDQALGQSWQATRPLDAGGIVPRRRTICVSRPQA